jgi:hypothetical protein
MLSEALMESNYDDREDRDTPDRSANPGRGSDSDNAQRTRGDDSRSKPERRHRQMTDDERIDEASEESFPASDPPQQP